MNDFTADPRRLKVAQDSLAAFPLIVSFFNCTPVQLPETTSLYDCFQIHCKYCKYNGCICRNLPPDLPHTVDLALVWTDCHHLLLTDLYNLLGCGSLQTGDALVANRTPTTKLLRLLRGMNGVWKTAKLSTSHFKKRASRDCRTACCSDLLTFLQPTQFDKGYSVRGDTLLKE